MGLRSSALKITTKIASAGASFSLTEEDISGAKLQEPYEKYTLGELRWWLLCRGVTLPSAVRKAQVIEKYIASLVASSWSH